MRDGQIRIGLGPEAEPIICPANATNFGFYYVYIFRFVKLGDVATH